MHYVRKQGLELIHQVDQSYWHIKLCMVGDLCKLRTGERPNSGAAGSSGKSGMEFAQLIEKF